MAADNASWIAEMAANEAANMYREEEAKARLAIQVGKEISLIPQKKISQQSDNSKEMKTPQFKYSQA